jgi:hypothetical protein
MVTMPRAKRQLVPILELAAGKPTLKACSSTVILFRGLRRRRLQRLGGRCFKGFGCRLIGQPFSGRLRSGLAAHKATMAGKPGNYFPLSPGLIPSPCEGDSSRIPAGPQT